jgi:DNA-binding MarR family transcriptional regulator
VRSVGDWVFLFIACSAVRRSPAPPGLLLLVEGGTATLRCMGSHTSADHPDSQRVLDAIRRIVQILRVSSRACELEYGLSAAQLFVLQSLSKSSSACVNDLAGRTRTHQSSVSVVAQRLVERGLIDRSSGNGDARRVMLCLTAAGRRLIERSPEPAPQRLIRAVEKLPKRSRQQLAALLEQIAADSAGPGAPPPMFFEEPPPSKPKRKRNALRRD